MATVLVEVNMYEIATEDLVVEVCRRIDGNSRKKLTVVQKQKVKEKLSDLVDSLNMIYPDRIEIKTLDDKIKYEHLVAVFDKYSISQIQSLLPI